MLAGSGVAGDVATVVVLLVCLGAVIHCAVTPARYFPVVGQLGKWTWLPLLVAATAAQLFFPLFPQSSFGGLAVAGGTYPFARALSVVGIFIVGSYLVDTRRKLSELRADQRRRRSPRSTL